MSDKADLNLSPAPLPMNAAAGHAVAAPGSPCANCAVILQGVWCYACGQKANDFHRSIPHLLAEAVEGLFHFDTRLWHTLPDLVLRPARLTSAYISGHRAPQIPPLRLFLITLVTLFIAGTALTPAGVMNYGAAQDAERAALAARISSVDGGFDGQGQAVWEWTRGHIVAAIHNPEVFKLVLEEWQERFALLTLPLAAAILALIFVFRRQYYLFDHMIFSMHSLSFQGQLLIVFIILSHVLPSAPAWLLIVAPVHLFFHMRGVYKTGIGGTLVRMAFLFLGSVIGFSALALALIAVGLNGTGTP